MKKLIIAFSAVLAMSPIAKAGAIDTNASQSAFAKLKSLYNAGQVPTLADLSTWRSGRCFRAETPSSPQNSLLVSVAESASTVGPAMPQHDVFREISYTNEGEAADFYDNFDQGRRTQLNDELTVTKNTYSEADISRGAIHDRSVGDDTFEWYIRKNQDTLIMEYRYFNEIQSMCYYYNKLN